MAFTIGFTTTLLLHKIHKFMPCSLFKARTARYQTYENFSYHRCDVLLVLDAVRRDYHSRALPHLTPPPCGII